MTLSNYLRFLKIFPSNPSTDPIWPFQKMKMKDSNFDRLEAQMDVAAATFIIGLTNTVTISAEAGPGRIGLNCHSSELGLKEKGMINAHAVGHGRYKNFMIERWFFVHAHIRLNVWRRLPLSLRSWYTRRKRNDDG